MSCKFAEFPEATVGADDERLKEKSCPVPDKVTDCGLPVALSVIAMDAERVPDAAGANLTLIVQSALAASDEPQLFVTEKSAAFVPVAAMLVIASALLPPFESVTACAELVAPTICGVNVKAEADSVAVGASAPCPRG